MTITTVIRPFRLQQQFGFSPVAAGAVLAPIPIVSMVVAPVSGLLSDRYPAGILGAIGMAIGFAGLVCLAFLPAAPVAFDIVWRLRSEEHTSELQSLMRISYVVFCSK